MKTRYLVTVMTLLAGAVSTYAQNASISMNDYAGIVGRIEVFPPQSLANSPQFVSVNGYSGYEEMGQPPNTYLISPGFTVYNTGRSTIGPGFDVGLLAADGIVATSYNQLTAVPNLAISTWLNNSGSPLNNNYGMWNTGAIASFPGKSSLASLAIAVWQNYGAAGPATTSAQAQADGYEWGVSDIATATVLTTGGSPGFLPGTLTSFSLADPVPEPSTLLFAIAGGSVFLFRKRIISASKC